MAALPAVSLLRCWPERCHIVGQSRKATRHRLTNARCRGAADTLTPETISPDVCPVRHRVEPSLGYRAQAKTGDSKRRDRDRARNLGAKRHFVAIRTLTQTHRRPLSLGNRA